MSFLPPVQNTTNLISDLIGLNEWPLQEATYNGVLFTWMNPSYAGVDPLASLIKYIEGPDNNAKPNFETTAFGYSVTDTFARKLNIFSPPNYEGDYAEDYNTTGMAIDMVGIIVGPSYQQVLDTCLVYFNDSEDVPGSGLGKKSKDQFRVLNHMVYGRMTDVFLQNMTVLTSDENYQAASFRVTFRATKPGSVLKTVPSFDTWKDKAQDVVNNAQGIISSIVQTFTLGQNVTHSLLNNSSLQSTLNYKTRNNHLVVVNGQSHSYDWIFKDVEAKLNALVDSFKNSMAFLIQNDGEIIGNPYWNSIPIRYQDIPLYLNPGETFSEADAQILIGDYADKVNAFIAYCEANGFSYNLQKNIVAAMNSLSYMDQFAKTILTKELKSITVETVQNQDLVFLMVDNNVDLKTLQTVNETNQGLWYSCLTIAPGTNVKLS